VDGIEQKILLTILDNGRGAPAAVGTIAASIYEKAGSIKEVYEPYLIHPAY
jgi:Holliday junction DNA helicase RuvB